MASWCVVVVSSLHVFASMQVEAAAPPLQGAGPMRTFIVDALGDTSVKYDDYYSYGLGNIDNGHNSTDYDSYDDYRAGSVDYYDDYELGSELDDYSSTDEYDYYSRGDYALGKGNLLKKDLKETRDGAEKTKKTFEKVGKETRDGAEKTKKAFDKVGKWMKHNAKETRDGAEKTEKWVKKSSCFKQYSKKVAKECYGEAKPYVKYAGCKLILGQVVQQGVANNICVEDDIAALPVCVALNTEDAEALTIPCVTIIHTVCSQIVAKITKDEISAMTSKTVTMDNLCHKMGFSKP